ncbi:MAG: WG repeat-containing protein, partial [Bacteroidota bacterium]
ITITDEQIVGKLGVAYTVIWLDNKGKVLEQKNFPNETALNSANNARLRKEQAAILQNNPDARKPRWVQNLYRFTLENGVGKNLLQGKTFFDIGIDENLNLSLAREVIKPETKEEKEKIISYLIDHNAAKVIFAIEAKDLLISDFNTSAYARTTVDTLWDALVDKSGTLITEIEGKNISNIGNFINDRAWVKSGKQYGFIDTQGKLVIPFTYEIASDFEEEYAIARKEGLFGCIDKNGKQVLPFIYDGIDIPKNNICRVKQGKGRAGRWGAVNLQNSTIIPFNYSLIYPFKKGIARMRQGRKWGLIDAKGKELIPPSIECDFLGDFDNDIAMVGMERWVEKTPSGPVIRYKKQGYIKKDGSYLLEPIYDKVESFEEIWRKQDGVARIYKNGKVGYVNYKGIVEVAPLYDETYRFDTVWRNNSGISLAKKDGKFGYIDHNGDEVLPVEYDYVDTTFLHVWADRIGITKVQKKGKFGYVNYQGKEVIPVRYEKVVNSKKGVILAVLDSSWGAVDTLNNKVLSFEYEGARFLSGTQNALIELLKKDKVYFELDNQGLITKEVTELPSTEKVNTYKKLPQFTYTSPYDINGLAVVGKKDKLALVDDKGKLLTKYKYKEIAPFSDGLALVRLAAKERVDQRYGFINMKGEEVITPQFKLAKSFSGGHAAVLVRSTWGFVDKNGKMVIQPKFKKPGSFSGGYAIVNEKEIYDKNGNLSGNFLLKGKITSGFQSDRAIVQSTSGAFHITPEGVPAYFSKYDEVTPFIGKVAFVKRGDIWELTRKSGEITNKLRFNSANKNGYFEKYGDKRKEKLLDGTVIEDLGWELIKAGKWKMIDTDGHFLSDVVFDNVLISPKNSFLVETENKVGLADLTGKILAEREYEAIKPVSEEVIRLEKTGEITYLKTDGTWLRKLE